MASLGLAVVVTGAGNVRAQTAPAGAPADADLATHVTATQALPPAPAPTSEAIRAYERSLPENVTIRQATRTALPLSLDDAVARGLKQNLQITLSQENQLRVKGLQSTAISALVPALSLDAYTNTQEINLAAMGFNPATVSGLIQGGGTFPSVVKVNVTDAQVSLNQQLFNVQAFFLYKAARKASAVGELETLNARGGVALAVAGQYLLVLADAAQVENTRAQVQSDQRAFEQAKERQSAGVGVHLDTLRAQVQLQTEQQTLIGAESTYAKDKIQLNRLMGEPADQEQVLTDQVPFADLAGFTQNTALAYAYTKRKDLLSLEAQGEVARQTERATRYNRLPTLAVNGYYGVLGETTGLYHGVFNAQGSLNFPIFKEAQFRGESEVARSQVMALQQQIDSLRITIDQQIQANRLDVQSSSDLVKVARSNVELSRQQLADSIDRFRSGISDNLPVVQAQATLAASQSQLVQRLLQYNSAKLQLARSVGVVETEYQAYLGR